MLKDKGGKQHCLPFVGSNRGVERFLKKGNIRKECVEIEEKENFMFPFYGWGSIASRLEPL